MADATLKQVKEFFDVPGKPVALSELKNLTDEDKNELRTLVGAELGL